MTRRRLGLIILIPVEVVALLWLGVTVYEFPHRLFTHRNHRIFGWIWQDVPIRTDGSWRFEADTEGLLCRWDLDLNNYSQSDTVVLSEVMYTLKDRAGRELVRATQAVYDHSSRSGGQAAPHPRIGPGETVRAIYSFPLPASSAIRVAHAHIRLAAKRIAGASEPQDDRD